jgi:hypothetical protein
MAGIADLFNRFGHGDRSGLTLELTHAEPKGANREAELSAPSGAVCSDVVGPCLSTHTFSPLPPTLVAGYPTARDHEQT